MARVTYKHEFCLFQTIQRHCSELSQSLASNEGERFGVIRKGTRNSYPS